MILHLVDQWVGFADFLPGYLNVRLHKLYIINKYLIVRMSSTKKIFMEGMSSCSLTVGV